MIGEDRMCFEGVDGTGLLESHNSGFVNNGLMDYHWGGVDRKEPPPSPQPPSPSTRLESDVS